VGMQENYHKWYTQYLKRDLEMLVFGTSGIPIILFPQLKSRYYDYKDVGLIESVLRFVEEGKIKIYCPDSVDELSWADYSADPADRVKNHLLYENTILSDVIEFAKYESGSKKVAVAGCGFGGYHALNIAFKHPDSVDTLITLGGTFDIKPFIHGFYDEDCYFNNPPDYMPNLTDDWFLDKIKEMKIILGVGEWDSNLQDNYNMSDILNSKGIAHQLDIKSYATHEWRWIKEMFPHYISQITQ
jgi:esterase/lipase superfamily enzyme